MLHNLHQLYIHGINLIAFAENAIIYTKGCIACFVWFYDPPTQLQTNTIKVIMALKQEK
jgi:hypothetical protein